MVEIYKLCHPPPNSRHLNCVGGDGEQLTPENFALVFPWKCKK